MLANTTIIFPDYAKWNENHKNPTNTLPDKKNANTKRCTHMHMIYIQAKRNNGKFDSQFNSYFY